MFPKRKGKTRTLNYMHNYEFSSYHSKTTEFYFQTQFVILNGIGVKLLAKCYKIKISF